MSLTVLDPAALGQTGDAALSANDVLIGSGGRLVRLLHVECTESAEIGGWFIDLTPAYRGTNLPRRVSMQLMAGLVKRCVWARLTLQQPRAGEDLHRTPELDGRVKTLLERLTTTGPYGYTLLSDVQLLQREGRAERISQYTRVLRCRNTTVLRNLSLAWREGLTHYGKPQPDGIAARLAALVFADSERRKVAKLLAGPSKQAKEQMTC